MRVARLLLLCAALLAALLSPDPVGAHNRIVHQDMTDMAYEIMLMVLAGEGRLTSLPPGQNSAEWSAFLRAISDAVPKLQNLPAGLPDAKWSHCVGGTEIHPQWADGAALGELRFPVGVGYTTGSDCGIRTNWRPGGVFNEFNPVGAPDFTGITLGFWASHVDDQVCDTHLFIRPASAIGLGQVKAAVDEAMDFGIEVLLLPFVCLLDCIFSDCKNCDQESEDLADDLNPNDDIEGLIPGVGDISGSEYVGLWHHINVQPGASNEFDDRQGLLFDEAHFGGIPDVVDFTLMAVFDASGMSINHDESIGISRYQIRNADDGHAGTKIRSKAEWQFPTISHLPFEPVDNLAYFGWRKFRDEGHVVKFLGWPLHAIGDAVVPMHVIGSPAWGHRPFEDAAGILWHSMRLTDAEQPDADSALRLQQIIQARRILLDAFRWRQFILQWRSAGAGRGRDVPVRDLVTAIAQETYAYSLEKQFTGWPFNPIASSTYLADEDAANSIYSDRADAVDLGRPLVEKAIAAKIAFLTSAAEVLP